MLSSAFVFARDVPAWLVNNYAWFLVPVTLYPLMIEKRKQIYNYTSQYIDTSSTTFKSCMCAWNATLSVYSAVSLAAIAPSFFRKLFGYGYHESVCLTQPELSYHFQPHGWWVYLFILSKIVEFGDTAFLVVKGSNVAFIHWYHHLMTAIFGFSQGVRLDPTMEWTAMMNLAIHTWMYGHYALGVMYPGRFRGNKVLTTLQIAQMFHAFTLTIYSGLWCEGAGWDLSRIAISLVYAYLFMDMFKKKYDAPPKEPTVKEE